jgi:hypothetical protein
MDRAVSGYDDDLVLWAEAQARALRARMSTDSNLPIDWENVAEEIEALGKSQSRGLASRVATIIEHLIKLEASPATDPRNGWRESIRRRRRGIERILEDAPSLGPTIAAVIQKELPGAKQRVRAALADYREQPRIDIDILTYTETEVLADWFPD